MKNTYNYKIFILLSIVLLSGLLVSVDQVFAAVPTFSAVHTSTTTTVVTFSEDISGTWELVDWKVDNVIVTGILDNNGATQTQAAASVTLTHQTIPSNSNTLIVTYVSGDLANAGSEQMADNTTITASDGINPTFSVTSVSPVSGNTAKVGDTVVVTVTAGGSETGLTASGTQTINAQTAVFAETSGGDYTITYTVSEGNTDVLDAAALPVNITLKDAVGNIGTPITTVASGTAPGIDANSPVFVSAATASTTQITITVDQTVTDNTVAFGDFTLGGVTGGSIGSVVSVSGTTITLGITGTPISDSDTVTIAYSKSTGSIDDANGNFLQNFSATSVSNNLDTTSPTVSVRNTSDDAITSDDIGNISNFSFSFNESIDNGVSPSIAFFDSSDATVTAASIGLSCAAPSFISFSYTNELVTFVCTISDSNDQATGYYAQISGAKDIAGNTQVTDTDKTLTFSIDTVASASAGTISDLRMSKTHVTSESDNYANDGDSIELAIFASKIIKQPTFVDFTPLIGESVTWVSSFGGLSWTATVEIPAGTPDGELDFTLSGITDLEGIPIGTTFTKSSLTDPSSIFIDNTPPTFVSASYISPTYLEMKFSEDVLDNTSSPYSFGIANNDDGSTCDDNGVSPSFSGNIVLQECNIVTGATIDTSDFGTISTLSVIDYAGNTIASPATFTISATIAGGTLAALTGTNTQLISQDTFIRNIDASASTAPKVKFTTTTTPSGALEIITPNSIATVTISASTIITGGGATPTIEMSVSPNTITSGLPAGEIVGTIIALGDSEDTFTFSIPVKVVLTGQAGNNPFYIVSDTTVAIPIATCDTTYADGVTALDDPLLTASSATSAS